MSLSTSTTQPSDGNSNAIAGLTDSNRPLDILPSSTPSAALNTYLMPTSPSKNRHGSDSYRPTVKRSTGQIPACLVNASVTYCGNNQIYAFGGFDQYTDEVYNHVRRLDLKTLKWTVVDNYGDIPGVRMGHTATLYENDKLIVFGGENERQEYLSDVVILDLNSSTWTSPEIRGPVPRGRARHAAVIYEDKLFVIGGVTGETNYILDEICYLDLRTWTWSRTWSFVARFDHTAWVWGDRLWVFGGLGIDMERGTDLWWLDLKGSPSFMGPLASSQGTVGSPAIPDRMAYSPDMQFSSSSQISGRPNGYAPNSSSVQVRSLGRRRANAPGAIASVKFHSGPFTPVLLSGTHFHVFTSGVLLDLVTPSDTVRSWECNLSSLELDTLRWQRLADGPEIFNSGHRWHYCTVNENGTKAWLLGCNINPNNAPGMGDENHLSEVLPIDLEQYGILGNESSNQIRASSDGLPSSQLSGLGAELATVFDQPPQSGSGTDFAITADCDDPDYNSEEEHSLISNPSHPTPTFLSSDANTSAPIHVHRIILQARWPHFKRLYAAQMAEFHTNRMHIPEPYKVVRAFLYFLYTDSIACHPDFCPDISEVAGMLVMANLYDMPRLRLLCVYRLSRELAVENAAIVWERAGRTNEEWLKRRAAAFCMANWGRIVRTEGFRNLNRQSLMELCEVVDMEGRVVGGHELEFAAGWGNERYDLNGDVKRSRAPPAGESDEIEGEEDDGMELS
ncbi:hypothetical protein LOZ57_003453 [Ophidiomyces ophidiicola]|uniref:uncharacterized protein n=1 Tax=Ophidiomyces ophidiicola TaxID=1387563 RepID=UPI0020C4EFC4|nr:uncharacterized protein LOZ57_003453 [Ophidiomyces ophidiicola]KAI1947214.1 hypothetical protein LOZ57_003453 [Ophidiomyces ophidiicola]KAI2062417.1 hypothetical protein LOZ43_000470 [Ophidiomyces ophidiicola]KAI2084767.1 hypothetical protein LOZ36_004528 [Ophidiomyces ophidiicola]